MNGLSLQIENSPYRINLVKCKVDVYEHLDNSYSVIWIKGVLGQYDLNEKLIDLYRGQLLQF